MSQPTPYTPNADFSQQEANNASGRSTVNTAALDAEFAAIETTLDQTLENIQLIQRDDGKLGDVLVEVRCLAPDVLNIMGGFNITGLWTPATSYEVNDICSNGDYTYVCKTSHVSGGSFDATNWIQFGFTAGADAAQAAAEAQVSANSAAASEINALAYKNSAQASATSATASASSASTSAATATTAASNAASSATSSSNSAAAAAAAAASIGGSVTATNTVTMTNKTLVSAKNDKLQLGVSGTATQNFTLTAEASDGSMKIARGNPGATTQDVIQVDSVGVVKTPQNLVAFSAGSASVTSLVNMAYTPVTFTSELFDTANSYDSVNSKFQPSIAGYYLITASVIGPSVASGSLISSIYKNGTVVCYGATVPNTSLASSSVVIGIISMNGSTDYVDVRAFQNSGSNANGGISGVFSGHLMSAI